MLLADAWNPLLAADFGTPLGPGKETKPGVFTREWSKVAVELDCNAWVSSLAMK